MSKIIFVGTTDFGVPALEYLKQNHDLLFVITQTDKPAGRKKILTSPAVKNWAESNGVKVLQPLKIEDEIESIKSASPDVLIVGAYGQIIPNAVLDIPSKGSLNLHTSLLPKYRGASPIQNAIMNGDKETGITIIKLDEKMDHGPIISQATIPIENSDTYPTLHAKLAVLAAKLLSEILPQWIDGKISPQEQSHAEATFVKMIKRDDARLDWTQPARSIVQKIKALNPEPGTWTTLDKKSVKILSVEEVHTGRIDLPGKIYSENKDCLVKCGDYSIKLLLVQPEGKNPISGTDYINGLKNLETKVLV